MISIFGMSISQHVGSVGIRFFALSIKDEAPTEIHGGRFTRKLKTLFDVEFNQHTLPHDRF